MQKRSSKPAALNRLAAAIVADATAEEPTATTPVEKNAAAVELGRRGGLKGGKARAAALSPEERKRIASEAAKKRWVLQKGPDGVD